jgi:hypothetical protein
MILTILFKYSGTNISLKNDVYTELRMEIKIPQTLYE